MIHEILDSINILQNFQKILRNKVENKKKLKWNKTLIGELTWTYGLRTFFGELSHAALPYIFRNARSSLFVSTVRDFESLSAVAFRNVLPFWIFVFSWAVFRVVSLTGLSEGFNSRTLCLRFKFFLRYLENIFWSHLIGNQEHLV